MPTSSGANLSYEDNSSIAAPLAIEGASDTDTEAYLVATSTKDALGAPPSFHHAADMATA